jgi:hypothetical protein
METIQRLIAKYVEIALARPPWPAAGRGRVQRGALRALRLFETVTTTQVMAWAFPRKVYRGERLANHDFRSARRVLEQIAVRAGRARTGGRPLLWRLRD